MMLARLGRGERLQAAGALVLLISMFLLPWWGVTTTTPVGTLSSSRTGWEMFTMSRWVWLLTVLVAGAYLLRRAKGGPTTHLRAAAGAMASLSAVLIAYRILDHPGGSTGVVLGFGYSATAGIRIGIWLALLGAVAVAYGAYLQFSDEPARDGASDRLAGADGDRFPGT